MLKFTSLYERCQQAVTYYLVHETVFSLHSKRPHSWWIHLNQNGILHSCGFTASLFLSPPPLIHLTHHPFALPLHQSIYTSIDSPIPPPVSRTDLVTAGGVCRVCFSWLQAQDRQTGVYQFLFERKPTLAYLYTIKSDKSNGCWSYCLPVFVLLMLHLASSTGWTELSCKEAQAFSGEGELGAVGRVLSFLVHSVSDACCWATGGADGPPPWSWGPGLPSSCLALSRGCCGPLFFLGEAAFKELALESWEPVVCLVWATWTSSSEKRTFFSELFGDDTSAFSWVGESSLSVSADAGAVDPLSESGLGDSFIFESLSFGSSRSVSVRASSSSKNSSNVVSEV